MADRPRNYLWIVELAGLFWGVYSFILSRRLQNVELMYAEPAVVVLLFAYVIISYCTASRVFRKHPKIPPCLPPYQVQGRFLSWERAWSIPFRYKDSILLTLLLVLIGLTVGISLVDLMARRLEGRPWEFIHDHPLQIEAAVKFLLAGQNPYVESYRQTPMVHWWTGNPALDHLVDLPFSILKSVPVYLWWQSVYGWYDERITQLVFFILALFALYRLFDAPQIKRLAILVFAFNPAFAGFFIEGRTDVVFISLLLGAFMWLKKGAYFWSVFFMALAVTTKHTAWFVLPFYVIYLWRRGVLSAKWRQTVIPFIVTTAALVLPFVLWDWRSFWQDIYQYPAGGLLTSYPIKEFNLGAWLVQQGIITSRLAYFPFGRLQIFLIPWLIWLAAKQVKGNYLWAVWWHYGLLLWTYWYLSRIFNDNYVGVLMFIFALAALLYIDDALRPKQTVDAAPA